MTAPPKVNGGGLGHEAQGSPDQRSKGQDPRSKGQGPWSTGSAHLPMQVSNTEGAACGAFDLNQVATRWPQTANAYRTEGYQQTGAASEQLDASQWQALWSGASWQAAACGTDGCYQGGYQQTGAAPEQLDASQWQAAGPGAPAHDYQPNNKGNGNRAGSSKGKGIGPPPGLKTPVNQTALGQNAYNDHKCNAPNCNTHAPSKPNTQESSAAVADVNLEAEEKDVVVEGFDKEVMKILASTSVSQRAIPRMQCIMHQLELISTIHLVGNSQMYIFDYIAYIKNEFKSVTELNTEDELAEFVTSFNSKHDHFRLLKASREHLVQLSDSYGMKKFDMYINNVIHYQELKKIQKQEGHTPEISEAIEFFKKSAFRELQMIFTLISQFTELEAFELSKVRKFTLFLATATENVYIYDHAEIWQCCCCLIRHTITLYFVIVDNIVDSIVKHSTDASCDVKKYYLELEGYLDNLRTIIYDTKRLMPIICSNKMKETTLKDTAESLIRYIEITKLICNDNFKKLKETDNLFYKNYTSLQEKQPEAVARSEARATEAAKELKAKAGSKAKAKAGSKEKAKGKR